MAGDLIERYMRAIKAFNDNDNEFKTTAVDVATGEDRHAASAGHLTGHLR